MASSVETRPVGDDVPQVDGKIAVGEDIAFQRRWWRFEKVVWTLFVCILLADLSGLLGRGPLANAKLQTKDGTLLVKYERVLRENTSSILTLLPATTAIREGKLQLHVSDSIVKQLGAQRIIPQPESSVVGNGGVTYTFPAAGSPLTIQIELKPSFLGVQPFQIGVVGGQTVQAKPLVLP